MADRETLLSSLLEKLELAGPAGLTETKLLGSAKKGKPERQAALQALLADSRVLNAGTGAKPRYILPKFQVNPADEILAKLEAAGSAGLSKAKLGASKPGAASDALAALLQERKVVNIGSEKKPLYVLARHYQPLEMAYAAVESKALPGTPKLYARKDLAKGCTGAVLEKLDEAIALLVHEKKLIRLQYGKTLLFLHSEGVLPLLDLASVEPAPSRAVAPHVLQHEPEIPVQRLRQAYQEIVRDNGFSDVLIAELQKRCGVPLDLLKPWLREESKAGRVLPTRGDWSLADAESRAAALEIAGEPHLRIRLL